jgi:hypothetical protein
MGDPYRPEVWDNSSAMSYILASRRLGGDINGSRYMHGQYDQQYRPYWMAEPPVGIEEEQQYSELGKILILLISFCDPVQGLANCLFFVFDIPSIRRRYAALVMMAMHRIYRFISCSADDDEEPASFKYRRWLQDEADNDNHLPSSETNE